MAFRMKPNTIQIVCTLAYPWDTKNGLDFLMKALNCFEHERCLKILRDGVVSSDWGGVLSFCEYATSQDCPQTIPSSFICFIFYSISFIWQREYIYTIFFSCSLVTQVVTFSLWNFSLSYQRLKWVSNCLLPFLVDLLSLCHSYFCDQVDKAMNESFFTRDWTTSVIRILTGFGCWLQLMCCT